jgi:lipoprotein NlpI
VPYYKRASEIAPNWKTAKNYLGDAYLYSGQYDLAIAAFNSTLALDAKNADAVYGIGLVYIKQRRFDLARAQKARLDALAPNLAVRLAERIAAAEKPAQ